MKYALFYDITADTLTIDGVEVQLDALKFLIEPTPGSLYQFSRKATW